MVYITRDCCFICDRGHGDIQARYADGVHQASSCLSSQYELLKIKSQYYPMGYKGISIGFEIFSTSNYVIYMHDGRNITVQHIKMILL